MQSSLCFRIPAVSDAVHVIVVNYNAGAHLMRCVRAVLASRVPVRITLVDNASTDDSLAPVEALAAAGAPVRVLRNAGNLGFAKAVNRALREVVEPFALILNPDCFLESGTLSRLVSALDAHPRAGMAGCLIHGLDGQEEAAARRSVPTPWAGFLRMAGLQRWLDTGDARDRPPPSAPQSVEAISGACMLVRMAAVRDVGGLDEGYVLHCEDLDWFVRFRQQGWEILFVPDATAVHVKGACSISRPVWVAWHKHRGMLRFYRKFYARRYPGALFAAVALGVGLRFLGEAVTGTLRRLRGAGR
ncbi:MAG TPA: glycosyltransferase family 2 protein [Chromatiales bacterium]|nr:glycosyltransferase family 2 protein [Chromatiales bacterium]